jgi:hypothetical protein
MTVGLQFEIREESVSQARFNVLIWYRDTYFFAGYEKVN